MRRSKYLYFTMALCLSACSMTKNIPEGEQLFTGLTKMAYDDAADYDVEAYNAHLEATKAEVEAALATEPNGSLFGSSYYTVPWSWHLWVYNTFSGKESAFAKWMTKSFGRAPVLMSQVNPALRSSVARSVLRNNGYFRGDVTYELVPSKNPKKSKIGYTIHLDSLFTLDTVNYVNFPSAIQALIDSTRQESIIKSESPFSINNLDAERLRISTLLRNNGYYYYNSSNASYLADTFAVDNKVQLRFQLAEGLPEAALRKWYIGKVDVNFRKTAREVLGDSIKRRSLTIHFNGKKSPIMPRVVLRNLSLRSRQEYSYEKYMESASRINATGVFASTDFQFTPRPDTDTLDLCLNCTFDKPYDFYIEGNAIGRTSGRYGPEARIGLARRNAFHAGEKLDLNLHGSYEWQSGADANMNSYQYGADMSIEFPRIIAPFVHSDRVRRDKNGHPIRKRFFSTPTTFAKISSDVVRRPEYYKMHIVSGEWTYRWQSSANSRHEFSPLTLKYQYMNSHTAKFDSVVTINPYLSATMEDFFVPKMRYTYVYTSPAVKRHPIRWEFTIEESGNLVSLWDFIGGHSFSERDKTLFKTPYSQFLRFETDFTKTWTLTPNSRVVGHLNGGLIYNYGNSKEAPYSEYFYVGGANTIRAFGVRAIGPGAFDGSGLGRQLGYLIQNGEIKLVGNIECRTRLFGDLNGAVFLDAGNVWDFTDEFVPDGGFPTTLKDFVKQTALGTGVGLRYDMGFLVIRLDWGLALHCPYQTEKSGYFNVPSFKNAHTLHFAVGYPF